MPRKGKRQSGTSKQQRGPSGAFSSNNKNDTNAVINALESF